MRNQIIALEEKIAHLQLALDNLTDTLLDESKRIERLEVQVKYLVDTLREAMSSNIASSAEETPPPHY